MIDITIEQVKQFFNCLDFCPYIEFIDTEWTKYDDKEIQWQIEGNVYSAEINGAYHTAFNHWFFNADNGCGETITYIFKEDQMLSEDEFEEFEG